MSFPPSRPNPNLARENFNELEAEAAARAANYRLEHRDELPPRPSVIQQLRSMLKVRRRA
jgi:hypothetical protein